MGRDPMRSTATRVAVVGLGKHAAKLVLPAVQAAPGWELAAVVSARPEAAAEVAHRYGAAAYPDLPTAVADGYLDAVYLATLPALHVGACLLSLEARVPMVICEKPLGVNDAEVTSLLAKARASDSLLYEVFAYQHHTQFAMLQRLLDSPEVGDLVHGYARFSYPYLPEDDFRYRPTDGGGSLLDAGVYPLSMAARLFGVQGLAVQATEFRGGRDVDVSGSATLTNDRGGSFQCSWGMGSAYSNVARFVGSSGTLEVPRPFSKPGDFSEPIVHIGGWGERTIVEYEAADQFVEMLEHLRRVQSDATWRAAELGRIEERWSLLDRVRSAAVRSGD
jgi:NDP-hexose-3-ketoreductase